MTLKRVKRNVAPTNRLIPQLQNDNNLFKEQLTTTRCLHESELARFGILSCHSLAWLNQILISIIHFIPIQANEDVETSQLTFEFLKIISLFRAPSEAINSDQIL